jgi:uncharacterized protein (TIGR03437 family)
VRLRIEVAGGFVTVCGLLAAVHTAAAQCALITSPARIDFEAAADSFVLNFRDTSQIPRLIGITAADGGKVPFDFAGAFTGDGPSFVVLSPSSGVTPAALWVSLNPNVVPYLPSRTYALNLQFATQGQSALPCTQITITLRLARGPTPTVTSVVNDATQQPGISPGAIVSVLGTGLGTPPLSARYDSAGLYPTTLGNTTVTFNGTASPLLYVSKDRINALVPYAVAGKQSADIIVTHNLAASPVFSVPIVDTSPGIFSADGSGSGPGAILNSDSTVNSADNPAPKGTAIAMFATGGGIWNKNPQDVSIVIGNLIQDESASTPSLTSLRLVEPVSLTIGGQPAKVLYAGAAPFDVSGKLQVNAVVPDGIDSGPQPIVLTIGKNSNKQQQVTVAVQ